MKGINILYRLILIALSIISTIIYSCKTSKKISSNKYYLEGLYCTEKTPSDTGGYYRKYLKFKNDGTVFSLTSTLECDSVKKLISKNYAETGNYTFINKDSIKFTFINNRVNQNEYTAIYRGKINNKNLKFVTTIQYKGLKPYPLISTYSFCQ